MQSIKQALHETAEAGNPCRGGEIASDQQRTREELSKAGGEHGPGPCQLQPMGQSHLPPGLVNNVLFEIQPCSLA